MHLSDSITLSVRNQPSKVNSPKKSDAKAVANILATRGITVTATPKSKEKCDTSRKESPPPPVALNLNNAVSIIPSAKNGNTKVCILLSYLIVNNHKHHRKTYENAIPIYRLV